MNNFNYKNMTPFKWFVLENFPFIENDFEAINNYRLFSKVVEYLNNTIDNVNVLGNLVEQFSDYFDNLDVQEEINNKLDEMAEDGTLQEIISSYLNSKAIFGYNTLNDMLEAENLIEGSFAKTYGLNTINDGGGQFYYITKEISATGVNGITKINMNRDDLYANLLTDTLNVKKLGVYGDGIHDDTNALQFIFSNLLNEKSTVYFPNGNYKITQPLNVNVVPFGSIKMETNAQIYTDEEIESLIMLNGETSFFTFDGGYLNANNRANHCIKTDDNNKFSFYYKNIFFRNAKISNLKIRNENSNLASEHGYIYNCRFYNNLSLAIGFEIYAHDYTIDNCEIFYTNMGAIIKGNTDIKSTHIWAGGVNNTNITTGIKFLANDNLKMVDMYFDGINTCVDTNNNNSYITLTNSFIFFASEGTYNNPIVIKNNNLGRNIISNNTITSSGTTYSLLDLTNIDLKNIQNWRNHLVSNEEHYSNGDNFNYEKVFYGNNINIKENNNFCIKNNYKSVSNGKYYKIGYIVCPVNSVSSADIDLYYDDFSKYSQNIKLTLYNDNGTIQVNTNKSTYKYGVGRYGLALGTLTTVTDNVGNTINVLPIYIKVINNQGNEYALNLTNNNKFTKTILSIYPEQFIKEYDNPNILLEDLDNN